jgi:nondiscriminating glutamyl-tRNA synthetase
MILFSMIVTRFPPSPTGPLHIGSIRTALYSYLLAKQNNGTFILRIEDTDRTRFVEWASDNFLRLLKLFGCTPDEWYGIGGPNGPYVQSERIEFYKNIFIRWLQMDLHTTVLRRLKKWRLIVRRRKSLWLPTHFQSKDRELPYDEARTRVDAGEAYSIRLKVPKWEKIIFDDMIRGRLEFATNEVEDQILLKTDGIPTYHGAVVLDDYAMKVTHMFRGEEWISSIPKQVLTARAFGIELPQYGHLPLILGTDRKKLSKRNGDVSVDNFLEKWYLVEAIINYIALLGWNPKTTEEFFTLSELIERFDVAHIQKAGAIFDMEKLTWMNGKYIAKLTSAELYDRLDMYLKEYQSEYAATTWQNFDREYHLRVLSEVGIRLPTLSQFSELSKCCYVQPTEYLLQTFCNEKMKVTTLEQVLAAIDFARDLLTVSSNSSAEELQKQFLEKIASSGLKNGQILYPVRVALSGEQFSPGAFELISILGIDESLTRLNNARNFLISSHELPRT